MLSTTGAQVWRSAAGAVRSARPAATLLLIMLVVGCQSAPLTGRSQLILVPESQDAQMGLSASQQIKQEQTVSQDPELNRRVQEVGQRIAAVSGHPDWDRQFTLFGRRAYRPVQGREKRRSAGGRARARGGARHRASACRRAF